MRILIETNGSGSETDISINGEKQDKLLEFHLSVHGQKKVKLQMVREVNGKTLPISFFGDDFKKYDEFNPEKKEN